MKNGYHVIATAGDNADFKGIFIIRKDSDIRKPADLKGKAVSYPAPTALAACIMPQYFLHKAGLNVNTDIENRYVGSQESSIMNAYQRQTAAAATWPTPWRSFQTEHPKEAAELKVIWETEALINNSIMARNDLPNDIETRMQELLTKLHETEKGTEIMLGIQTTKFTKATDTDYNIVRNYVDRFEREVRKIETK